VLEVDRPRRDGRSLAKSDTLEAVRAARTVLARERPTVPRAGAERDAPRALVTLALEDGRYVEPAVAHSANGIAGRTVSAKLSRP
jgi:hypothetical protein